MNIKKAFFIVSGCVSLVLCVVGAVVPLLPSVPFLLLSVICFAKSSPKLHQWLQSTKLYKKNMETYFQRKGMTWKTKLRVLGMTTALMAFSFFMMGDMPTGRIVLCIVWAAHLLYFIFGVKTIS
ncbi:MAG: YbaN family protein [Christensenellales bacterium]